MFKNNTEKSFGKGLSGAIRKVSYGSFDAKIRRFGPRYGTKPHGAGLKIPYFESDYCLNGRTAPKVLGGESLKELLILSIFSAWFSILHICVNDPFAAWCSIIHGRIGHMVIRFPICVIIGILYMVLKTAIVLVPIAKIEACRKGSPITQEEFVFISPGKSPFRWSNKIA